MKIADGASFSVTSQEQISSIASRLSLKEINLQLCIVCGINEPKSVALIKLFAQKGR